jgi:dTMP kinase
VKTHTTNGILVVIEGIDGSGKTTLMYNLAAKLTAARYPVCTTKEPGDTQLGKQLRTLLQEKPVPVTAKAEYLLFAADRAQHVEDVIKPALSSGKIILCDRMGDSSVVYQGYGRGLSIAMIKNINTWALDGVMPTLTLYVRIPHDVAFSRLKARGKLSSFEQEAETFTSKLLDGFETLYASRNDVVTLDGMLSPEALAEQAYTHLEPLITHLKSRTI